MPSLGNTVRPIEVSCQTIDEQYITVIPYKKSKITKVLNSEENSPRKVHYQMTKSKAKTNQTNE